METGLCGVHGKGTGWGEEMDGKKQACAQSSRQAERCRMILTASISVNCSATISGEKERKSGFPSPTPFSSTSWKVQPPWSTAVRDGAKLSPAELP